ncbi:DUF6223 family protein [Nonomuraea sp. NPDC049649]|uniref:DUF6223 family protein n=1 Tax=Nonomuraea sp. NPDC049649 TaxID=3155776 RepID=UPI00342FA0DF
MTGDRFSGHSSSVELQKAEGNFMSVLLVLATQAASPVCTTPAECAGQGVDTFLGTPERIWASVAALVALGGVVIGWLALRSVRRIGNSGKVGSIVALVAGLTGGLNGAVKLAVADGGLGTGNGVFGAALALVLGLVGAALGGLALARSRRIELSG